MRAATFTNACGRFSFSTRSIGFTCRHDWQRTSPSLTRLGFLKALSLTRAGSRREEGRSPSLTRLGFRRESAVGSANSMPRSFLTRAISIS